MSWQQWTISKQVPVKLVPFSIIIPTIYGSDSEMMAKGIVNTLHELAMRNIDKWYE